MDLQMASEVNKHDHQNAPAFKIISDLAQRKYFI